MNKVKITVLKIFKPEDVLGKSISKPNGEIMPPCELFKEGDVFLMDSDYFLKPEGFCEGAWKDIRHLLITLACGGNFPWYDEGIAYGACSDGLRPVCFKLERI